MATDRRIEVEAKYRVAPAGAADRYLVAPELGPFAAQGAVHQIRIEDRYVDSPDWALARAGFAARLRKTSRGTQIGLKARATAPAHVHRREEIEGPADDGLTPSAWPTSSTRDVVLELCGDQQLVELVTLRQLRRIRQMQASDSTAELSVDEVEVVARGETIDRFEELELELKSGGEEELGQVVAIFDKDAVLRRQTRSKFDRALKAIRGSIAAMPEEERLFWQNGPDDLGLRQKSARGARGRKADASGAKDAGEDDLPSVNQPNEAPDVAASARPEKPEKPTARNIGIQAADSMPEAARKVLAFHFRKLKNREAGTRSGSDPEELHNMRVAARRMRAAWRVFDGSFKPGRTRKLRRRLGIVADRLGAVRDLDVLIANLDEYRAGLEEAQRPGLEPLFSLWRKERNDARSQLMAELDSREYATFLDDMGDFLESGANSAATIAAPTTPHRVRDRAPSEIWSSYESVRVYELVLPWADVETLHELRICTKWLRYALEFFGELLGTDSELLLTRVALLQDHLGMLHDADVAAKLTRDVLVSRAGELTKAETDAIGAYLQSREREVARRRRALGPVWRAVDGAPFRRALGRATASL
jgi:CHAD domain-containing protein